MEEVGLELRSDQSELMLITTAHASCTCHFTLTLAELPKRVALTVPDQYVPESIILLGFYSGFTLSEAEGIVLSD